MYTELEERLDIIRHKLKFIAEAQRPFVLMLTSLFPKIPVNTPYSNELVALAGGRPAGNNEPDLVIIVTTEPMQRLFGVLPEQLLHPEWAETAAVRNNRVYVINGQQFFQLQDGSSMADDAEALAEIINPGQFIYGHNGEGWIQFDLS